MERKMGKPGSAALRWGLMAAAIAILAAMLYPTVSNRIDEALDEKAIQNAKNAYTRYLNEHAESKQGFLYVQNERRIAAIKEGKLSETVFATRQEALKWLFDDPVTADLDESVEYMLISTDMEKLFACSSNFRFIHISFDDVTYCLNNLKSKAYGSLFDEPFFGWLKQLHNTYGAKFSLYAYADVLDDVPSTYAHEFAAAADWLKIGLHAEDADSKYDQATYEQGRNYWNTFVSKVIEITGGTGNIDRVPRLHYYYGGEAALKGMRDAQCGAVGFLAADDSRVSYYFNQEITDYLYNHDHITDHSNGLVFLSTDMRGDWFVGNFTSQNQYKKPIKNTVYEELDYRYCNDSFAASLSSCIFFAHEWRIYDGIRLTASAQKWIEDACRFAAERCIEFAYPQDMCFDITQFDIYPPGNG